MMATPSVAKNAITSTSSHLSEACRSMPFCRAQLLLLSNEWREELTMLGPELGDGISAAIEEERDPRNLLISFTLVKKVLGDFPAACASRETVQSLFETLSSYFPITFQPPKGDKVGITGDDLRQALSQAFCSSQRLAELVIPFLLDASKDIEADVDATVAQAMQTLCFCLQNFGATAAQKHLKHILETCRDQVCRTKTTCGAEFCKAVTESLKVSLQGVPAGLHPHWLAKDVVPQLQEMADDASKGRMSLASEGARQLLLSAAAAHPIVYESVWSAVMKAFLEGKEGEEAFFSIDALEFMVELLQRQQGVFTAKQLQPALKGALETMRTILPQSEEQLHPLVASVELVKRLARLSVASEALQAWQMALLGAAGGPWSSWATAWQEHLSSKPASDPCVTALVQAVCEIMPREIDQAFSLAERLLKVSSTSAEWLPLAMPQLLAHTALSLARAELKGEGRENRQNLGQALLLRASEIFRQHGASGHFEILASLADALDLPTDEGTRWVAAQIATALGLPSSVPEIAEGLTTDFDGGLKSPSVDTVLHRAQAARRFLRMLCRHLPEDQARGVQRRLLESIALSSFNVLANCTALLPGILPEACAKSWNFCQRTMPAVCRCASDADPDLAESTCAEAIALEALEALVENAPVDEVPMLLENFRDTFGQLLRGSAASARQGRGAALCWASATSALLRRSGAQQQAAAFLEALLNALDQEAPVGPFVPLAFRVLAPVKVEAAKGARAKLPPLALQQLSRTVLPSLLSRAKALESQPWARRAALESAVALLAGLSPEVASTDCSEELRFCTLTSLKRLKEEAEASVFGAQVLQLLVRAIQKKQPWVEDDLHSVVLPICDLCSSHRTPLVRLGCFQVLIALIQQAFGHLAPYKKQIEAGCKRGVEDRCREVRLLAVAALNAWHCVGSQ
ncbi:unnamed protein product [Durusdinium trenchii]|uniref:MMS19 nucleotide excision repair protein n=1 Tax=Durusdinium trenchii TaxID=1381693 RepID=A0ABP0KD54_9DINO